MRPHRADALCGPLPNGMERRTTARGRKRNTGPALIARRPASCLAHVGRRHRRCRLGRPPDPADRRVIKPDFHCLSSRNRSHQTAGRVRLPAPARAPVGCHLQHLLHQISRRMHLAMLPCRYPRIKSGGRHRISPAAHPIRWPETCRKCLC